MAREIDIPGQGNQENSRGEVSRKVFGYLAHHFQEPVSFKELYIEAVGVPLMDGWENHLYMTVYYVRKILPESLSLYSLPWWSQYLLDQRRPIGFQFIPSDRGRMIIQCSEEVQPFLRFWNEVEIQNSLKLKSRLTHTEYSLMRSLGLAYPEPESYETLIREIWEPYATLNDSLRTLWSAVSNLRKKVKNFQGLSFGIVREKKFGYKLAPI